MANPHRGEVAFTANGKMWTLKFGANAFATMERRFGVKLAKLGDILADVGAADLISLVAIGLKKYHPEITEDAAGDLIDDIGLIEAGKLIGEAINLAVPTGEAAAEANPSQ